MAACGGEATILSPQNQSQKDKKDRFALRRETRQPLHYRKV